MVVVPNEHTFETIANAFYEYSRYDRITVQYTEEFNFIVSGSKDAILRIAHNHASAVSPPTRDTRYSLLGIVRHNQEKDTYTYEIETHPEGVTPRSYLKKFNRRIELTLRQETILKEMITHFGSLGNGLGAEMMFLIDELGRGR